MTVATDGIICYGFFLGEDLPEMPWDDDIEEWWYFDVHGSGFKHTFMPFTEEGDYKPGINGKSPCMDKYHAERKEHQKKCPVLPVEMVNSCSSDYPVWIAAVPGSVHIVSRGYPEEFDPSELVVPDSAPLKAFLDKYVVPLIKESDDDFELDDPSWYLGSYWDGC